MADLDLSFRAQSLDNQSPDPAEINNRRLTEENVDERQELAQKISRVSLDGTQVFSEGSHVVSLHHDEFLLKTPSDQLDDAGRTAPLLCYGHVPEDPQESWPSEVVTAVVGFAERIGRTISGESQKKAHHGVEAIVKKKRKDRSRRKVLLWSAFLAVLSVVAVVLWILFKK